MENATFISHEGARNAAGWDMWLAALARYLDTGETGGPHGEAALDWRERYDHWVAAGIPSGAAVPAPDAP